MSLSALATAGRRYGPQPSGFRSDLVEAMVSEVTVDPELLARGYVHHLKEVQEAMKMSEPAQELGFAPVEDRPIAYLERIRGYYAALGYGEPYRWAHYGDVPFAQLPKPLSQCRVALITTAAPYRPEAGDQGPHAPYNAAAKFYAVYSGEVDKVHDLRISHVAIDRKHTTGEDMGSYFPLAQLRRAAKSGRIGSLAPRFHGAPTNRSHRHTREVDCPELVRRCKEDGADAAILVPNCPVCHQTVSLSARMLEESGIATVIMGCAKDIVEYVGVPRFLFSDFPLGNSAGRPKDEPSQAFTLDLALKLIEAAPAARTTVQSPLKWSDDHRWKADYCNAALLSEAEILRRRKEFDEGRRKAKEMREVLEL